MTMLEFDGIAFNPLGAPQPSAAATGKSTVAGEFPAPGEPAAGREAAPTAASDAAPARQNTQAGHDPMTRGGFHVLPAGTDPIAEIRAGVVAAHRAALSAQTALQRELWRRVRDRVAAPAAMVPTVAGNGVAREGAFKALARTGRTELDRAALLALAAGEVRAVFGPGHHRHGVEAVARIAATTPLALTEVTTLELYGGRGNGRVLARFDGDVHAAAVQAAEVFALFTGMPLVLSGSTLTGGVLAGGTAAQGHSSGTLELIVDRLDLVPRPHLEATATFGGGAATVRVLVEVAEAAGAGIGPGQAVNSLLLNEFHMAHLARGDQRIAMGPEFAPYTGVRATRLPTGGLLLVDRVVEFDGARGVLEGATYTTEYVSPADSWYYADTADESMPHFVYMETSLQAALLMGYYAGPTLTQPGVTLSLRNLGGTATVLRQVDLRDATIEQTSRLLSTTILPGSSLQTFDYTLSVDGRPFYRGETMFGYFSDEALANQTGLDAGRFAPTWLAGHPEAPVRVIDVAARRADSAATPCARGKLALIDRVEVVDEGGDYGAGYLRSLRAIDPDDWFFARHFHLDPVIPGSLGVESVIHAVQEWMLDAGFAAGLTDPVFRIPRDIAFSWRYRGQFLPSDGSVELEVHIKSVRRGPNGVTVVVDGSLWKPGLRIYELVDLSVELADRGARA
ncbi:beta-ketoacyl synthase [Nocardia jejuensis]|uniref:beta-ketoacyl synthase n=1 Tax=Nocardia jejuensis TaxID=328049 RepID=UPI00082A05FB|nr:beta-ketoacyl synthase [Nocardia jejuensis]